MNHSFLVRKAVEWLRSYRCGVVLSEQACVSGEMPDAIGWKRACHSVLVECKVSRADFLADRAKPFRQKPDSAVGCERFYLAPRALIRADELPAGWGLLELHNRKSRNDSRVEEKSPQRRRLPLRDEPAARQPAPRRNPHRATDHHRISEVAKPDGRIQRRPTAPKVSPPPKKKKTHSCTTQPKKTPLPRWSRPSARPFASERNC